VSEGPSRGPTAFITIFGIANLPDAVQADSKLPEKRQLLKAPFDLKSREYARPVITKSPADVLHD
jgi:hypothetical protein